jgi:hypothetical protein
MMASDSSIRHADHAFQFQVRVALAMVIACAIYIGSSLPTEGALWFPLLRWPAEIYSAGLLDLLKLFILALLVVRGPTVEVLLAGAASVLLFWVAKYSGTGAFVPTAAFNLLLFASLITPRRDDIVSGRVGDSENSAKAASLTLAIIFFGAALQKLNASYLAGNEFVDQFGFLGPVIEYSGQSPDLMWAKLFAWGSVALEFGIAVGALFWPRLAAHSAVIFCLVLSLLHPPVLFVYLTLCPLLLLIDKDVLNVLRDQRYRSLISSEFLWMAILLFGVTAFDWTKMSPSVFYLRSGTMALILLSFHVWKFWTSIRELKHFELVVVGWKPKFSTLALLAVFAATPVAAWLGAPAPIGFTMFSGRGYRGPDSGTASHQVRINDPATCGQLAGKLLMFSSTDGRFYSENNSSCVIAGPTASGLSFVLNRLCEDFKVHPDSLETRPAVNVSWETYRCPM